MRKYKLNTKKLMYYVSYTSFLFPNIAKATLPAQNFYALYNAASAGKVHVISRAVSRGLNIDTVNANGDTGLCVAIKRKDTTAYKLFLHFGANPNHSCILRIPQQQYIKFISRFPRQEIEYTSASARYAKYPVHNVNYVRHSNIYKNGWFSSPIGVTVGVASLIAGGVALAGGGGGGGSSGGYYWPQTTPDTPNAPDTPEEPDAPDTPVVVIPALNGVGGTPVYNNNDISLAVADSAGSEQSSLWGLYAENNNNLVNTGNLNITTTDTGYNREHWGGVYSKNGYIFNTGSINIVSDNYYAAGLMACVVDSVNPANTACFVNPDKPIAGDINNSGSINIEAHQSSGIFSGDIKNITNDGTIKLQGYDNSGIFVYGNADKVVNNGKIELEGGGTDYLAGSMNGIWVSETADIVNNNEIKITNTNYSSKGIYNSDGNITNKGTVTIEGNGAGLQTKQGNLSNENTITINNTNGDASFGMKVDEAGTASNSGSIIIQGSGYGMYSSEGTLTNETEGIITITGSQGYGITGNGTNNGYIYSSAGGMFGKNIVNNNTIESYSISLELPTSQSGAIAENHGTLKSRNNAAIYSKADNSTITNTGIIESYAGIDNFSGTINNSGTIETLYKSISNIKGSITNSGTIHSSLEEAITISAGNITNTADAVISSDNIYAIYGKTTTTEDDKKITADLTVDNAGIIKLTDGGTAIIITKIEDTETPKLNINNSGYVIVENKDFIGNLMAIDANIAKSTASINNSGTIQIDNYNSNHDNTITAISVNNGNISNTGNIIINNKYTDPINPDSKNVIGIKINEGTAVNEGFITINSNNAIGMLAEYTGDSEQGTAQAINKGTIEMNGSNNIAMYAKNTGATISNSGTIIIKQPNLTDIYHKEGDTVYNETDSCNSFICLENGGTYINSGEVISEGDINFNDINGISLLSTGSRIAANNLSGTVYANYDLVTGSFDDTYTSPDDSLEGNTDDLEVKSYSSLFRAGLTRGGSTKGSGIILSRKSFYEFTPNQSVAQYLENNYRLGHNLELFDNIKSTNTAGNIAKKIDKTFGLKLFPNFSKQVLDDLRIINANINKNLLTRNNNDTVRTTAGYSTHYREQDNTLEQYGFENKLQSLFGIVDKKQSRNSRMGFGLNYIRSDAEYDEDNKRNYNLLQILTPFIYHNSLYQFISTPRIGFLWGSYKRYANNKSYHADTQEYYYGITNELRQSIALEKFILEPKIELNITGLYTSSIKEAYGLNIKGYNDISAELGFGIYATKDFEFNNKSNLSLRVGGSTYFELLNPYQRISGSLSEMNGEYKFNKTSHSKNRSVLNTSVEYQHGDMNLIAELNKYIEETDGYEVNMRYQHKL